MNCSQYEIQIYELEMRKLQSSSYEQLEKLQKTSTKFQFGYIL